MPGALYSVQQEGAPQKSTTASAGWALPVVGMFTLMSMAGLAYAAVVKRRKRNQTRQMASLIPQNDCLEEGPVE
jgi:hypothetical protein